MGNLRETMENDQNNGNFRFISVFNNLVGGVRVLARGYFRSQFDNIHIIRCLYRGIVLKLFLEKMGARKKLTRTRKIKVSHGFT